MSINLLPWRQKKQKNLCFTAIIIIAMINSILGLLIVSYQYQIKLNINQVENKNQWLQTKINKLSPYKNINLKKEYQEIMAKFLNLRKIRLNQIKLLCLVNSISMVKSNFVVINQIIINDNDIPVGFQEAGEARARSSSGAYIEYVSSEMSTQQSQNLKGDGYINIKGEVQKLSALMNFVRTLQREKQLSHISLEHMNRSSALHMGRNEASEMYFSIKAELE